MEKLTTFSHEEEVLDVEFVETQQVKEGVVCDIYSFPEDNSRDLGVISVKLGCKTPLQKVLRGERTVEGYLNGAGILTVIDEDGRKTEYSFPNEDINEVEVKTGQTMQWYAVENLIFYEICEPPYEDGRFQNLSES